MKMRKIYYLPLLCLVALAGCKKEDMTLPVGGEGDALVLNATLDGLSLTEQGVQSRAVADMTATDFDRYGFDIAGYYTVGDFDTKKAEAYPNVFDHDPNDGQIPVPHVTKGKVTADKFALKTVKWALTDNGRLSFFAWGQNAPRASEGGLEGAYGITNYTKNSNHKGYPWIDVKQAGSTSLQVDIVGARVMDETNDAVISAVDLEFHHLLSKLSFRATTSGPKITFTKVEMRYNLNKCYSIGRYTFGKDADKLGTWKLQDPTYTNTWTASLLETDKIAETGKPLALGSTLVIPQPLSAAFANLEVTYTVEIAPGVMSQTISRTLPMPAVDLQENTNHVFTLDFVDHDQVVFNTSIAPWTEVTYNTLPLVPGPRLPDVLIELDGTDAPFYDIATGKRYWLDRSGWNRHAEIVEETPTSSITHNAALKCYTSPGGLTNWIRIPELPNAADGLDVLSVDVVTSGNATSNHVANIFSFSNKDYAYSGNPNNTSRQFSVHIGNKANANVYLDTRGSATDDKGRYVVSAATMGLNGLDGLNALAHWSFSVNDKANNYYTKVIYNGAKAYGAVQATLSDPATDKIRTLQDLKFNKLLHDFNGNVHYFKVMRKVRTDGEVLGDYINVYRKFGIPDTNTDLPPVKEGLVLCFDGRDAPNTSLVSGKTVWPDRGPYENHAVIQNTSNMVYRTNANGIPHYYFNANGCAALLQDMPYQMNQFTVELVMRTVGRNSDSPIGFISSTTGARFTMHVYFSGDRIFIDMPLTERYDYVTPTPTDFTSGPSTLSVVRDPKGVNNGNASHLFYQNNLLKHSRIIDNTDIGVMTKGVIGASRVDASGFAGDFYAIRIYDRPLTEAERKQNYEYDQRIYGIE